MGRNCNSTHRWEKKKEEMMLLAAALLVLLSLCQPGHADCYMHNPRGSNNRLNGNNNNRDNDNRLFDSQNNDKGGYCWGPKMYYYVGSLLPVEWTNQHECGVASDKVDCQIVLQYMCAPEGSDESVGVRDGTTEQNTPNDPTLYNLRDSLGNYIYGMHESYEYYQHCSQRQRNKGLFIADNTLNDNQGARATRQNNGGGQSGFECPEERDYYPYWHPTPWRDIAILTSRMEQCAEIQANSQNVMGKGNCSVPEHNTDASCIAGGGTWTLVPSWGMPAPECLEAPFSRQNHLGNGLNGYPNMYNWTIPNTPSERCVLRIRYNITTRDGNKPFHKLTAADNGDKAPVKQNPYVSFLGTYLRLAINTGQFGRTFQDRSRVFEIRRRPGSVDPSRRIINLNVRGKRGNIVQTYPSVEYDFVPNIAKVKTGDYLHIQWTGCDNNPQGNDGEGRQKTDRSNIVPLNGVLGRSVHTDNLNTTSLDYLVPGIPVFWSASQADLMATLGQTGCLTIEELNARNNNNQGAVNTDLQNCAKLNAADRYFDGGLLSIGSTGVYRYMSSRNNNFSNRGQKATIVSENLVETFGIVLLSISGAAFAAAIVIALVVKFAPASALAASAVGV